MVLKSEDANKLQKKRKKIERRCINS